VCSDTYVLVLLRLVPQALNYLALGFAFHNSEMANHLWQEHFGPLASIALPAIITCILVSWFVGLAVDRLWLNPLARIPGPRLAALTSLYEFHFECLLAGKYIFEIERMHQHYGRLFLCSLVTYETQAVLRAHRANQSEGSAY
jgi:hypothetical protein